MAALTGPRREGHVTLTLEEVGDHSIQKKTRKVSRGKRRYATIPRIPELDTLFEELKGRYRRSGVDTVLMNSEAPSWSDDGFGGSFGRVRDHANIVHIDSDTGAAKRKHIHDLRGTFCTKLMRVGLSNQEIAEIMAWSPDQVARIRRIYVDQTAVIMAIGERIRQSV